MIIPHCALCTILWCTVPAVRKVNDKMGGDLNPVCSTYCTIIGCTPCFACQFARAVKKAKADGTMKLGQKYFVSAPTKEAEMSRAA